MNPKIKAQWIARLRDPEAKQTSEVLERVDENGNVVGQCCLGVLCQLAAEAGVVTRHPGPTEGTMAYRSELIDDCNSLTLPRVVMSWAGLPASNPDLPGSTSLAELNDEGVTFPEIADLIERHL